MAIGFKVRPYCTATLSSASYTRQWVSTPNLMLVLQFDRGMIIKRSNRLYFFYFNLWMNAYLLLFCNFLQITHVATQYGQTAFLYYVVSKWNADPDVPDNEGRSPLHWYMFT